MALILRPFVLVAKAVRAFFVSDLHLRHGSRGLVLVLDEPAATAATKSKSRGRTQSDPQAQQEQRDLRRMQESLARLLDEVPANRNTLRHLAFFEHALGKKGLRALNKVPYDVLKRALDQFEGLVVNWSDEGLAALRSKMAVALIEREPDPSIRIQPPTASDQSSSVMDTAPLAHPTTLEGQDAADAEAALLAAYGAVVMTGLSPGGPAYPPAVELHVELNSPSGKALAKALRRGDDVQAADMQASAQHN